MVPKLVIPPIEVWVEKSRVDANFLSYSFIVFPSRCDYPHEVIHGKFWGGNSEGVHFDNRNFRESAFWGGSEFGDDSGHDMESFTPPLELDMSDSAHFEYLHLVDGSKFSPDVELIFLLPRCPGCICKMRNFPH